MVHTVCLCATGFHVAEPTIPRSARVLPIFSTVVPARFRELRNPSVAVQGLAPLNVMRTYPDPLFASNAVGRRSSRFGALSQVVSVSPSRP